MLLILYQSKKHQRPKVRRGQKQQAKTSLDEQLLECDRGLETAYQLVQLLSVRHLLFYTICSNCAARNTIGHASVRRSSECPLNKKSVDL